MIQANELRTENLVLKEGLIYEIYSVNTEGEIQLYKTDEHTNEGVIIDCRIDDIEAIELTEDVFNSISYVSSVHLYDCLERFVFMVEEGDWNFDLKDYPFLHQLQNLYFALTGQELEINL